MQKRPFTNYVPYTLSTKFPLVATLGCCFLPIYDPHSAYRFHDCTELLYCHSGRGMLVSENREFPFQAGDVLFISPYMPHYLYKTGSASCRYESLHINLAQMYDPAIFPDIIQFAGQLLVPFSIPPVIQRCQHPVFGEIVWRMLRELSLYQPYFEMSIKGYCLSLISMLRLMFQNHENPGRDAVAGTSLYPALLYINRNFHKDISIPELANLCCLSETHFRRLFKRMFSMSPLDYLNHIRIRESCMLLSRRSILISQAAKLSGFRTLSSYNRKFQEIMELSPTEWLKNRLDHPNHPYVIYRG